MSKTKKKCEGGDDPQRRVVEARGWLGEEEKERGGRREEKRGFVKSTKGKGEKTERVHEIKELSSGEISTINLFFTSGSSETVK